MPRADALLYAALLRAGQRFRTERLPLLGCAGGGGGGGGGGAIVAWGLSWRAAARAALETPQPDTGLAEGARLLGRLHQQLEVLLQAEEHTRQAMAEWAALADRFALPPASAGFPPLAAAAAAEAGLTLLSRQAAELADPLQLELAEAEAADSSSDDPQALSLDELAAAVRTQHPALFPDGSGSSTTSGGGSSSSGGAAQPSEFLAERAAAVAGVVHRQERFRCEPFEWVYEGLEPLLLPPRLRRRKLAPITLATVAAGVAARLGLPLLPVPADCGEGLAAAVVEGPAGGAAGAAGGLPLEQLRPDVAQRYAGRAQGVPPAAGPWVLLLGGREQQQQPVMDACSGALLSGGEAQARFPALQLAADWRLRAPLTAWQHQLRTLIQAHQRRGESDMVAHWVYVLLALDPHAPEWGHMLGGSG